MNITHDKLDEMVRNLQNVVRHTKFIDDVNSKTNKNFETKTEENQLQCEELERGKMESMEFLKQFLKNSETFALFSTTKNVTENNEQKIESSNLFKLHQQMRSCIPMNKIIERESLIVEVVQRISPWIGQIHNWDQEDEQLTMGSHFHFNYIYASNEVVKKVSFFLFFYFILLYVCQKHSFMFVFHVQKNPLPFNESKDHLFWVLKDIIETKKIFGISELVLFLSDGLKFLESPKPWNSLMNKQIRPNPKIEILIVRGYMEIWGSKLSFEG